MLSNLFTFVKAKGSSLTLPAHGRVGARATRLFSAAHFAKQNTNSVGVQSEGEAEGGCGGNSASPEPKRSPAALLVQSRPPKKSFVFLLKEKIGRAQIKNCEQNFSLSERALASGGGAERQNSASGFSLKKVRISFSVRSHKDATHTLGGIFFNFYFIFELRKNSERDHIEIIYILVLIGIFNIQVVNLGDILLRCS